MKKLSYEHLFKIKDLTQKELVLMIDFLRIVREISINEKDSIFRDFMFTIQELGENNERFQYICEEIYKILDYISCQF